MVVCRELEKWMVPLLRLSEKTNGRVSEVLKVSRLIVACKIQAIISCHAKNIIYYDCFFCLENWKRGSYLVQGEWRDQWTSEKKNKVYRKNIKWKSKQYYLVLYRTLSILYVLFDRRTEREWNMPLFRLRRETNGWVVKAVKTSRKYVANKIKITVSCLDKNTICFGCFVC